MTASNPDITLIPDSSIVSMSNYSSLSGDIETEKVEIEDSRLSQGKVIKIDNT